MNKEKINIEKINIEKMNETNTKLNPAQIFIALALLLLLGVTALVEVWVKNDVTTDEESGKVIFSEIPGFYDRDVMLKLSADQQGDILYTLDGSEPRQENTAALTYSAAEGILLSCGAEETVYTVRAALAPWDEETSVVYTATYIIGEQIQSRYDMQVLAISGAPEDLMGEEKGIFASANRELRGRESERAVNITLFDDSGNIRLNQNCGIRIYGGKSREKNQPSFRLFARSEYDEQNDFDCLLYEDYDSNHALITGYKQVVVRNGGNDHGYAHLRSEFASRLSAQAGYPDTAAASPVCVYINGEYYGVYWFETSYDDFYFTEKYGEYDGEMVTLEGVVSYMESKEDDDELTLEMKEAYNALHEYVAYADLNEEANWEALNDAIDVENYLQYVAIQNYFVNTDAFLNNFKVYRYYSPDGEYQEGTVFDGRYRFLLYDLDMALGYGVGDETLAAANILSTANRINYQIFYNALFSNIVSTQTGRDYYVRYYLSLLNYYFAEGRAVSVLEEMHESQAQELQNYYSHPELIAGNVQTPEDIDYSHVTTEIGEIEYFLANRPAWALLDLEEAFGLEGRFSLSVQNPGEANITIDFAAFHDTEYSGTYFSEVPVVMSAEAKCGYKFDYWLVDGVEYDEPVLTITGDMLRDEVLYVECVTSADLEAGLLISAVKSRGGSDYIELTNYGTQTVNLSEYLLADDADERSQSTLPSIAVASGETITVYCKNYTGAEAIGKPETGFNIKAGETLYLYRGGVIQTVDVPKLGTKEGIYRMDPYSGEFYEQTS